MALGKSLNLSFLIDKTGMVILMSGVVFRIQMRQWVSVLSVVPGWHMADDGYDGFLPLAWGQPARNLLQLPPHTSCAPLTA